jgi:hypothetical protein
VAPKIVGEPALFGLDGRFWLLFFVRWLRFSPKKNLMFMSTMLLRAMSLGFESKLDWRRIAYWDPGKRSVVILNPDGVFTPRDGADYSWNVLG